MQEAQAAAEEPEDDLAVSLSDVHAALLYLRGQLYNRHQLAAGMPPLLTKQQVRCGAGRRRHARPRWRCAGCSLPALLLTHKHRGATSPAATPVPLQLYTVLTDRTSVDRDLDQLRLEGVVRLFKLPTGGRQLAGRGWNVKRGTDWGGGAGAGRYSAAPGQCTCFAEADHPLLPRRARGLRHPPAQ